MKWMKTDQGYLGTGTAIGSRGSWALDFLYSFVDG